MIDTVPFLVTLSRVAAVAFSFPGDLKCGEKHTCDFHTEKTLSLLTSIMCNIFRHVALMYHFKCKVWGDTALLASRGVGIRSSATVKCV